MSRSGVCVKRLQAVRLHKCIYEKVIITCLMPQLRRCEGGVCATGLSARSTVLQAAARSAAAAGSSTRLLYEGMCMLRLSGTA